MYDLTLTPDNSHLSEANNNRLATYQGERFAINCTNEVFPLAEPIHLTEAASELLAHAIAPNTERAYHSDLRHFRDWGGTLPATPAMICAYLGDHAGQLAVATILRRVATLSKAHALAGAPNPCQSEIVKNTLRGLKRKHRVAQQQARPLLRDELFLVLERMGDSLRDLRDRALLLLGFAGGFRRSELVALARGDLDLTRQGLIITLRRSKT